MWLHSRYALSPPLPLHYIIPHTKLFSPILPPNPSAPPPERLQKLDQHQGFVKGVCWDPVGEFLATQSDDRTVKIWRTDDWGLEAEVRKPFEDSPGSTFFRRLRYAESFFHSLIPHYFVFHISHFVFLLFSCGDFPC